jgi:hypothetical protein
MKAVTTEQIRTMRAKYEEELGNNAPLIQVIDEVLEYRWAEECATEPRSALEVECGPTDVAEIATAIKVEVQ